MNERARGGLMGILAGGAVALGLVSAGCEITPQQAIGVSLKAVAPYHPDSRVGHGASVLGDTLIANGVAERGRDQISVSASGQQRVNMSDARYYDSLDNRFYIFLSDSPFTEKMFNDWPERREFGEIKGVFGVGETIYLNVFVPDGLNPNTPIILEKYDSEKGHWSEIGRKNLKGKSGLGYTRLNKVTEEHLGVSGRFRIQFGKRVVGECGLLLE